MKIRFFPVLIIISGCATVPVTGRRSLSLVSDSEVQTAADGAYRDLLRTSRLSSDRKAVDMVREVGKRIAAVADARDFVWEFNLIDAPNTANAFCMPGGKVAFYSGILPITKNETGVAVVMGHEIAHAIAKHGAERMSQALLVQLGGEAINLTMSKKPKGAQQVISGLYSIGTGVGIMLPYGRKQESEADYIGLIYMARAGYDPRQAVAFWKRMDDAGGGGAPEFLSTHPSHTTRIRDIESWLPEAIREYENSPKIKLHTS